MWEGVDTFDKGNKTWASHRSGQIRIMLIKDSIMVQKICQCNQMLCSFEATIRKLILSPLSDCSDCKRRQLLTCVYACCMS